MAEGRRSSILKPPKQRAPLQEVSSLNIHNHDDFTTTTVTQNIIRRVSFAGTSTIKEFDTRAESLVVCHTPAYEESFATSDSSVPSDHSSRLSSRSTISIEDQSTPFPHCEGVSLQNLDPEVLMLREFGVEPPSQCTKSPPRRPRFSIAGPSDEDDSPAPAEKLAASIPAASFYGKQIPPSPKLKISAIPRPPTIDPFTLRPKTANSPKSQSKLVNSPKSQPRPVNSPKSQPRPVNSPRSQSKRISVGLTLPLSKSKSPLAKSLFNANESTSSEMDLTEAISGNIFVNTPSPDSVDSQGTPRLVSTPLKTGNGTVVGSKDTELTVNTGWKNKTLYENAMDITTSSPARILADDETECQFSIENLQCTVQNSMRMEFARPVSGVAMRNNQQIVTGINNDGKSVARVSNALMMGLHRAFESAPIVKEGLPEQSLFQSESSTVPPGLNSSYHLQRNIDFIKSSNTTTYDAAGMDLTETVSSVFVPTCIPTDAASKFLDRTVSEPVEMEFTKVIRSMPETVSFTPQPLNAIVSDPEGTEFTRVIPGMPSLSQDEPHTMKTLNQTLNDSMGMDFTEAISSLPVLQERCFSEPLPSVGLEIKTSDGTLNESMGMDFTEAIPSAPVDEHFAQSLRTESSDKSVTESAGMGFTKAIPSVPVSQENHTFPAGLKPSSEPVPDSQKTLCDSMDVGLAQAFPGRQCFERNTTEVPTKRTSITLCDSSGMELNKVIHTPLLPTRSEVSETCEAGSENTKPSDSVSSSPFHSPNVGDCYITDLGPKSSPTGFLETSLQVSQSVTENSQRTMNVTKSHLAPQAVPLSTTYDSSPLSLLDTLPSSKLLTPPKSQMCLKRPFEEVDNTEQEEISFQKSRVMPVPLEIVIPSSRSPSPVEDDSSTRFPGLCQSFCGGHQTTESETKESPEEVRKGPDLEEQSTSEDSCNMEVVSAVAKEMPTDKEVNFSMAEISTHCPSTALPGKEQSIPSQPMNTSPSAAKMISSTSEGMLRECQTPGDYNLTDLSGKPKSVSPERCPGSSEPDKHVHKSIMDVSIPSMADISDDCGDRDLSGATQLYATLLEAENNVSVFHKEREELMDEESKRSQEAEELDEEETKMSVCEEQWKEEERKDSGIRSRDSDVQIEDQSLSFQSVIPNGSPCLIKRDESLLNKSTVVDPGTARIFGASRSAEEILKEYRSEYKKRARCNWTWRKSKDDDWCFNYLEDSVELKIKVEEWTKKGHLSGHDGRFVSLVDDELHGVWYIGGRLLYQRLTTEEWTARLKETSDVLSIVEDANLVTNDVEVFMTHMAYLQMSKNIDITHDWIRFDVVSQKTPTDRWFKVKVDCRDLVNIRPQHVTIENIFGETRETDIQNLVTCVKKNGFFLKNYIAVVEEYVRTIERVG